MTSTSTLQSNIHGSKIMLCVWWKQKGLVYYELQKLGDSIMGDRYRLQLIRLSRALREKRPEYEQRHNKDILHDNARPHVAKIVKKYLKTLKWDVLPHPSYFPDITSFDYWLFRRNSSTIWQVTGSLLSQKSKIGSKIGLDRLQRRVIFSRWNSKIA